MRSSLQSRHEKCLKRNREVLICVKQWKNEIKGRKLQGRYEKFKYYKKIFTKKITGASGALTVKKSKK